ncbi:MAG TPA: hypothetical protein VHD87_13585 [Acidimicrobiales bacterium]|nr:hypothetical protein [Acidimicrobiales bacterium]
MLFVHEVHRVAGKQEHRFEDLYRDWAALLAKGDDARLLWFMHQGHGTGPAYVFVTVTAVASAAALDDLNGRRRAGGDLHAWTAEVDALRYGSVAKVLEPAPFSPLQSVDLASVPAVGACESADGSLPLFMEDTAWPHPGRFDDYLEKAGTLYVETLRRANERLDGHGLLELVAAFIPRYGSGVHREIVLWQRVANQAGLLPLLNREVPDAYKQPGSWMIDALEVRDQWESRLLRVSGWSPLG